MTTTKMAVVAAALCSDSTCFHSFDPFVPPSISHSTRHSFRYCILHLHKLSFPFMSTIPLRVPIVTEFTIVRYGLPQRNHRIASSRQFAGMLQAVCTRSKKRVQQCSGQFQKTNQKTNGTTTFRSFGNAAPNFSLYHWWPRYALGIIRRISLSKKMYGGVSDGAKVAGDANRKAPTCFIDSSHLRSANAKLGKGEAARANPSHSIHSQK